MKQIIRENIHAPYSLHDMCVTALEGAGEELVLRTQSGMVRAAPPYEQPDGHVVFHGVEWDLSYAYVLDFAGNAGPFTGEKMPLKDFIHRFAPLALTVMDETYGYNMTKYTGYLSAGETLRECMVEICHEGDMVFVDETVYTGMGEVILSHDGEAMLYAVPAEVAADLNRYCLDFAANWVWHGPENGRFLRSFGGGQLGAVFGAPDFIDYLNRWAFPGYGAKLLKGLGCYSHELPEEYRDLPRFNF